ncbi:HEAT repeat domain-containing protein [Scytonema hofmannii]|uniref:HEAT repeat domain-containing protein n=1 Tax=Scytonema hofmannii TaxID=34078 RepID=UPI0008333D3D|nr:HEAT repeat domain-containing protein [Scytonema hofmannii]
MDEIFEPTKREEVVIDIINFTKTYPDVRVMVTSRVIGYKPQLLREAKFRHFMLQDLELEQIEDFLKRWHDLAFGNSHDKERKRERLRAAIDAYAPIRELAGNPLLLTMMAILNRNQELPRYRAELYKKASRVLLEQWDVERSLVDKTVSVDYKDKQAMLRQVAYYMQTNKKGAAGNLINAENLESILTSYLQKRKVNDSTNVANLIIQQLRERNFILCFLGAEYYAFVHRTFLEYFCATEYVWQFEEERSITLKELKTDIFSKYWQDESWHEVLRLIAGMLSAKFIGEIIDELIEKNGEAQKFSNLFLAAQCFAEVKDSESISSTATRLLEQIKKLTKYDLHYYYGQFDFEETSLVSKIRTQAVATVATTWKDHPETFFWLKTRATSDEDSDVRTAAVQQLATAFKDDPETLSWLKTRATSDEDSDVRTAAVQQLATAFKDDPETLSWLKTRATSDEDSDVRTAAVQQLATAFKDDPETLSWLKTRAISDEDSDVRTAAVQQLAKAFKDDPETLTILKTRATSDEHYSVRRAAVQQLARTKAFKDDPETLTILKTRATSDEHYSVRTAAVQQLATAFKDDPETLTILKTCATSDEDSDVRTAAVQQLARAFKDDPETLTILKTRATSDEDYSVRRAAVQQLARTFKDDPETLTILKTRATSDKYYSVRTAAVEQLARAFKDDPETLTILKTRATSDKYYSVRTAALQQLAHGFKDDPETLTILKTRATSDKYYSVRTAALQQLAHGWKDELGMFGFLCNIAVNDPFKRNNDFEDNPRQIALMAIIQQHPDRSRIMPVLKNRAKKDRDPKVRDFAKKELRKRGVKIRWYESLLYFFRNLNFSRFIRDRLK